MGDESVFPPERFANLMRDAGINSPEALLNMLRGNAKPDAQDVPTTEEKGEEAGGESQEGE